MMGCIYMLTCIPERKSYIGQTRYDAVKTRVRDHLTGSGRGNRLVKRAVEKYGRDAFTYEILHDGIIPEFLNDLEIETIKKFNTLNPHGYNLATGGSNGSHSEETRRKISEIQIGRKMSKETCQKKSKSMMGKNVHPLYEQAHQFFLSLPATMTLNQKRKVLRNEFPSVLNETICNWVRKWKIKTLHAEEPQTAVHKFYVTLPASLNVKQKREVIYKEFPNIEQSIIQSWTRKWTGFKDGRSPEYHQTYELFLSLPSEMSVAEKRLFLHENVENVLSPTITVWVNQWTNSTGQQPRHPQYKKVYDFFLSLPAEMSRTEKNNVLRDKFSEVSEHTIRRWTRKWQPEPDKEGIPWNKGKSSPMKGVPRSAETRKKMSEKAKEREAKKRVEGYKDSEETLRKKSEASQRMWNDRRPPKHLAKEFYLSLPETLSLSEKRKLLLEEFSHLSHEANIRGWVREWSGIKSEPLKHPKHYDVKNYFFSLPPEMNLIAKRKTCYAQFPDILKSTISRWIQKWGNPSDHAHDGRRHPKYYDVHKFFLTLPPDLDIQEKRLQCYSKFPDILQCTILRWIQKWQPNDSTSKKHERQKNQEQGYELFLSLPHNLTIEEKRKFLREKMPNVNRRTIYDWTKKWQSDT